jgi:hypothetical protein
MLFTKYYQGDDIREDKMHRYVACMWVMRNAYNILATKFEGEKLLGRLRSR